VHPSNGIGQLHAEHALEQASGSAGFDGPGDLGVGPVGGQDDDSRVRELLANPKDGIPPVHERHLQVHEGDIRTVRAELLDGLAPVAGFRDHDHVRFALQERGDPFPKLRMIVHGQNPDGVIGAHVRRGNLSDLDDAALHRDYHGVRACVRSFARARLTTPRQDTPSGWLRWRG
jgi:hypothetical protein